MTESQLEEVISKAIAIRFVPGVYRGIFYSGEEAPGQFELIFNDDDLFDVIDMYKYIKNDLQNFVKSAEFKQTEIDRIKLTLMIEKDPAIILIVDNLRCSNGSLEYLIKKEPQNKPINFFVIRNEKPASIEEMAFLAEHSMNAEIHQPIQINLWKGVLF